MRAQLLRAIHSAWRRRGLVSTLLWPLSWITALVVARKQARYRAMPALSFRCDIPVVVVGNIMVGGTGKTPVVIALAQALQHGGWRPGVISRGYGARIGAAPRTGRGVLDPAEFGDEPALIAGTTQAPLAVHPRRILALQALRRDFPEVDVIISDDGLQHLALGRDIEIIVQDARGIGNGRLLPAGPLREPATRLQSADFVITNLQAGEPAPAATKPESHPREITMTLAPARVHQLTTGRALSWRAWRAEFGQTPVSAVAAIGQPERFFAMLRHDGIKLERALALPDHDDYARSPFTNLPRAPILITAKDAVKCTRFNDDRLWVVHADPQFSDPGWLDAVESELRDTAARKQHMARNGSRH